MRLALSCIRSHLEKGHLAVTEHRPAGGLHAARFRARVGLAFCAAALASACGGSDDGSLFGEEQPQTQNPSCTLDGTWATFVEIGVGWSSTTISDGAGTVRQWTLGTRRFTGENVIDVTRACGIGAQGVPLGSPWFSTRAFPTIPLDSEWTGVQFLPELFDSGRLPPVELVTTVTGNPADPVGGTFDTEAKPFMFGVDELGPEDAWPDVAAMQGLMVDHDWDTHPGLTGVPFTGAVPGEPEGTMFTEPRLGIEPQPARASALFLGIRTRAALRGTLVTCDRLEGHVIPESLQIESRNVGCTVLGTNAPCSPEQVSFIDSNLPVFQPNGGAHAPSVVVGLRVPSNTTCAEVRAMDFGVPTE